MAHETAGGTNEAIRNLLQPYNLAPARGGILGRAVFELEDQELLQAAVLMELQALNNGGNPRIQVDVDSGSQAHDTTDTTGFSEAATIELPGKGETKVDLWFDLDSNATATIQVDVKAAGEQWREGVWVFDDGGNGLSGSDMKQLSTAYNHVRAYVTDGSATNSEINVVELQGAEG